MSTFRLHRTFWYAKFRRRIPERLHTGETRRQQILADVSLHSTDEIIHMDAESFTEVSRMLLKAITAMESTCSSDGSVFLQDVTSLYTSLCLMGPNAKAVLSTLTDTDLDKLANFTIRVWSSNIFCHSSKDLIEPFLEFGH
jgi:hypothetical protein